MALNSSGPISLGGSTAGQSVNLAVGQSATASISLNSSVARLISGTVAGSQISMPPDFWGKSFTPPVSNAVYDSSNNWNLSLVYSTANASTGDYYVIGYLTDALYSGPYYGYVAKYNSLGVQQWQQAYSYSGTGIIFYGTYNLTSAVYDPSSGNVYIIGKANGGQIIIAINGSTGAVVWTTQFTPPGGLSLYDPVSIGVDSAGNPLCMFQTSGTSGVLIKLNSSGAILWQKTADVYGVFKYADTITTDSSNNIYVATRTTTASISGMALLKLDSSGNVSFFTKMAATNALASDDANGYGIRISSTGRLYMGGYIYDQSIYTYSAVLMELSTSTGNIISSYVCRPRAVGEGTNAATNIYFDSNGYVYCMYPAPTNYSYILARFPADLSAPMWNNGYGDTTTGFRVYSFVQIGNSYVAVGKGIPGSGNRDMGVTMQMPIDGSLTGTKTFSTLTANSVTAYDSVSLNTVSRSLSNSSAPINLSNSSLTSSSITVNAVAMPASLTVENRSQS